jgi:hypothetical protein
MARWPERTSEEILDYDVDWTARLEDGDVIIGAEFVLLRGSVLLDNMNYDATSSTVWLRGGVPGENSAVRCLVHTQLGRTMEVVAHVRNV